MQKKLKKIHWLTNYSIKHDNCQAKIETTLAVLTMTGEN